MFGEVPPGTDTEAATATVPAKELFNQTAALLGIPKDGLSTALLAFMRFFSLSPGAALMGNLRREVLGSLKNSPPGAGDEKTSPEAEALAAVIAQDKGVSLSPEALEHYARFLVPPALPKKEGDSKKKDAPEEKDDSRDSEALPDAEGLSAAAGEETAKEELLAFLNALPGKNGQRWAVYPLKLTVRGTELLIFIRLLKREPFSRGDGDFLIADVTGPKHGWRCCLKKTGGKYRADIRVYPGLPEPELSLLKKEAEKILGEGTGVFGEFCGFEEILLRNGEKAFSWADELCAENLPAVNKEV